MAIQVYETKNSRDSENVYRFLYEIWAGDSEPDIEGVDREKRWIRDELDAWARQYVAVDETGRIVGCVRINLMEEGEAGETLNERMKFKELITTFGRPQVSYVSRLAVTPSQRGGTVASLLLAAVIRTHQKKNIPVGTFSCPMNLVPFYYRLGMRPYTANYHAGSGVRVPLILCATDVGYLRTIESPMLKIIPRNVDDEGMTADKLREIFPDFQNPGFDRASSKGVWARLAYASPQESDSPDIRLFAGLSQKELSTTMLHVSRIEFDTGDLIFKRGEREEGMGLVISGSLGVSLEDNPDSSHIIAVLKPGETFGEMQAFGAGERTANVLALEKSEVMLLPPDVLDRVVRSNATLALKLSKNLLKILTTRLASTNHLVSSLSAGNDQGIKVQRPALYRHLDEADVRSRLDSDALLAVEENELNLGELEIQAAIAEQIELEALKSIGLTDGMTVMTYGTGQSLISRLVAEQMTESPIIGVERNAQHLVQVNDLISRQGLDRCSFLAGQADHIPLDDESVDFAYGRFFRQLFPEHQKTLKELRRLTRPGGIICGMDVDDDSLLLTPGNECVTELNQRVAEVLASAGRTSHTGGRLLTFFREVGLELVRVEALPVTTQDLSAEEFFQLAFGVKCDILEQAGVMDEESIKLIERIRHSIEREDAFGVLTLYLAHGAVLPQI